jgi:hypothetical protein
MPQTLDSREDVDEEEEETREERRGAAKRAVPRLRLVLRHI